MGRPSLQIESLLRLDVRGRAPRLRRIGRYPLIRSPFQGRRCEPANSAVIPRRLPKDAYALCDI